MSRSIVVPKSSSPELSDDDDGISTSGPVSFVRLFGLVAVFFGGAEVRRELGAAAFLAGPGGLKGRVRLKALLLLPEAVEPEGARERGIVLVLAGI